MAQEVRTVDQRSPTATENPARRPNRPVFVPPSDIYETKDSIVVLAEMPGVAPDGVDITLERRVLTIRGRSAANEHGGYQWVYNEYADGDYERVLRSPKTSTATASRRHSRMACCISFCPRRKPPRREGSSSNPSERQSLII